MPTKGKRKFTRTEREAKITEAARLEGLGWNTWEIGKAIGVSQVQAWHYIQAFRLRYKEHSLQTRDQLILEKRWQYIADVKELKELIAEQRKPVEKVVTKEIPVENCAICGGTGKRAERKVGKKVFPAGPCGPCQGKGTIGGVVEIVRTTEGRLPDPAVYALIQRIREAERELMGLDAPKQTVNKNENVNVEQWNVLVGLADGVPADKVEPKLVELLEEAKTQLPKPKLHEGNGDTGNGDSGNGDGHKESK